MSAKSNSEIAVIGIDIGKNSFHVVGLDRRGAIVLRQKWSRGQVEARLSKLPPCLIGMEACVGAHHLSRKLTSLGHDARLMPAKYVRPYSRGQKNDFRDAEAIAEAVQRPTMKFVATKTAEQLDLQALHRVRERLVSQRTGIINQIRAFLLERGVAVRQGLRFLRAELPRILARPCDALSPRMLRVIEDLAGDWRRLDERIEGLSSEIEVLARQDVGCERLMSVPGIGPIISSAIVAAIGGGDAFSKGRDFAAWLGLVPRQISTGDRTILGKISKRGNRYLRVLFVQAAWVVLIKPKSWQRHGLKPWLEAAKKRLHHNVLAIALPTSSFALLWSVLAHGRGSTIKADRTYRRTQLRRHWIVRKSCLVERAPHAAGGFGALKECRDIGKRVRPVLRDCDGDCGLLEAAIDNSRPRQLHHKWPQRIARESEGIGLPAAQQDHGLIDRVHS
jgi:transposase